MNQEKNARLKRSLRRGGYIAGASVLAIAIVVILNLIVGQLPSNYLEFDLSDKRVYTVSETSVNYLKGLDQNIDIVILAEEGTVDERILKFVYNYAALSGRLSVKQIDPVVRPSALTEYEAEANTIVVRNTDTGKQTTINIGEIIGFDEMNYYYYGVYTETDFDAEGLLTSAVDYVVSDVSATVYTMENHGESSLPTLVTDALDKAHLGQGSVSLLLDGGIPADCSLLLSYAPTADLSDDELQMLRDYLAQGGQAMLLMAASETALPNWEALLLEYGLETADGYVADMERYYQQSGSMFYIFPKLSSASTITSGFSSDDLALVYYARGLTEVTPARDTISVEQFMTTSADGYAVTSEAQAQGTYILGAAAMEETDGGKTARLTVITAETLIEESLLASYTSLVNLNVFVNAATAGIDEASGISIAAKSLAVTYNTVTKANLWGLLFIAVIPLATLGGGLIFWIRRRKL